MCVCVCVGGGGGGGDGGQSVRKCIDIDMADIIHSGHSVPMVSATERFHYICIHTVGNSWI